MEVSLPAGDEFTTVTLPDRAQMVPPGLTLPLPVAPDPAAPMRKALEAPLDLPPLADMVRPGARVTLAFDDATVPCYAPMWEVAIPLLLAELERGGVARRNINLLCANAMHRKFTHEELAVLLGDSLVAEFADRLRCHDAEDPDNLVHLGNTANGYDVELNRAAVESDLLIYLNTSTTRGFSGGWKSICVGLSTWRSIRWHHTPDTMSMSIDRNRMHAMLDEMGEVVEAKLGRERIFKVETVLANPLQVASVFAGSVGATRLAAQDVMRQHTVARRDLLPEKVDIVLYGVPGWSPYAAFATMNPLLTLVSTGLGYLGGVIEALGKPGCTVILVTPCPEQWDDVHHPSYREVWERVLSATRDPYEMMPRFEAEFSAREDYIDRYRNGFGFHPLHALMATFPLKRLRHAGRVIVAGAASPAVVRHVGFEPATTVAEAIAMAEDTHGRGATIAAVQYPPAFNRQLA
jgi:hypothetical protein